jgi:ketosteroid isomerase-like protein
MGGLGRNGGGFDEQAFRDYIAAFNRNDFDELGRYYAQDVEFEGRAATLHGREELLRFYRGVKSRIRETIAIQDIVAGERALVADLITELHPLEDWPDFPTGPLRKGETRCSQNFVWYDLADGRFVRIRAANYRRGASLVLEPRAPATEQARALNYGTPSQTRKMTVDEFAAYIDAFNRDDYDGFSEYYHPEVVLVIGGQHEMRGPQVICDFYRRVKAQTHRTIRVRNFVNAPDRIAAELESEFLALEDAPDSAMGPMKKGDRIFMHTVVLYELRDGRFVRIRSAALRKLYRS